MGTNYYLHLPEVEQVCKHCRQTYKDKQVLHIGKSSAGWCFSLHVYPEFGINTLDDWLKLFDEGQIVDEDDNEITQTEMIVKIISRSSPTSVEEDFKNEKFVALTKRYRSAEDFHQKNHSEPGPMNLLRHKIDGIHCVGHGEGTWDYIAGEFS